MTATYELSVVVNGASIKRETEPRRLLVDFLRDDLKLTATHAGCEHGVCGSCTVLFDGRPVRSCLVLAVQANGHDILTVEGISPPDGLSAIQQAFWDNHAVQCGFCTPGFLVTLHGLLERNPEATDEEVRAELEGILCRCTGYQNVLKAALCARDACSVSHRVAEGK